MQIKVVILSVSVITGIHFQVIKCEHHMLYSHQSFSNDGKSYFLLYFCTQRAKQGIKSQESQKKLFFCPKNLAYIALYKIDEVLENFSAHNLKSGFLSSSSCRCAIARLQVLRLFWCPRDLTLYVCLHLKDHHAIYTHCIGRMHSLATTSGPARKVGVVL